MASLFCVMSLILKNEGGLLTAYVMRDAISCSDFCLPCMPRCCTRLIRAQTMRRCHVAGFVRYIHGFTLNSTSFPNGK